MLLKLDLHRGSTDGVFDVIVRDHLDAELADSVLAGMGQQLLVLRRPDSSSLIGALDVGRTILSNSGMPPLLTRLRNQ